MHFHSGARFWIGFYATVSNKMCGTVANNAHNALLRFHTQKERKGDKGAARDKCKHMKLALKFI